MKGINNNLSVSLRGVKYNMKEAKTNFFCKASNQKEGVNQALMSRVRVPLGFLNLWVSSEVSSSCLYEILYQAWQETNCVI